MLENGESSNLEIEPNVDLRPKNSRGRYCIGIDNFKFFGLSIECVSISIKFRIHWYVIIAVYFANFWLWNAHAISTIIENTGNRTMNLLWKIEEKSSKGQFLLILQALKLREDIYHRFDINKIKGLKIVIFVIFIRRFIFS